MRRRVLARRGHRSDGSLPRTDGGERRADFRLDYGTVTYAIRCLDADRSVERALDRSLMARGHRCCQGSNPDWQLVVISDLTPISWLHQTMATITGRAVVVISAPVSTVALADLAAYQWVDHRRRGRRSLERLAVSIGDPAPPALVRSVPESLDRRIVPFAVLGLSGYFLLAAVLAVAVGIASVGSADVAGFAKPYPAPAVFLSGMVGAPFLAWAGSALLRRRIPLRALVVFVAVATLGNIVQVTVLAPDQPIWRQVELVASGPLLLLIFGRTFAAWLPPRKVRATGPTLAVNSPAW
jgi:hypothetical protein